MKNTHMTLDDRKKFKMVLKMDYLEQKLQKLLTKISLQFQKKLRTEEN